MNEVKSKMTFATRLRELRHAAKESQSSLARKAGLEPSHIAHFEAGRREPNLTSLRKVKNALGCSWKKLLDW